MEWIMNWWWATAIGPIVLGCVIAYALLTRRRLSPDEKAAQRRAVRREYGHEPAESPAPARRAIERDDAGVRG